MSLARRLALLEWAQSAGAWVLEDDYDSEFRYVGAPIPSLQGLDAHDRVVYLGTFSKTMFPALRLGYLIVPPALVDVFTATQNLADRIAPSIEHATLAEFIDEGHFTRHVRQMRSAYAERHDVLLRGVRRELAGLVDATPAETGMHLVTWLRDRSLDTEEYSVWGAGESPEKVWRRYFETVAESARSGNTSSVELILIAVNALARSGGIPAAEDMETRPGDAGRQASAARMPPLRRTLSESVPIRAIRG